MVEHTTIRLAALEDLADLCGIVQRAIDTMQAQGINQWDSVYPCSNDLTADIEQGCLYVIQDSRSTSLRGLIALNEHQDKEYAEIPWVDGGRPIVVHRLTIDPEHQGKGLASQLMAFAEQHARSTNHTSIRLDAYTVNDAACGLYVNLNYKRRGTVRFRMGLFHCYEKVL